MELFKKLGRIANVNTACLNHLGVGILTLGDFFMKKLSCLCILLAVGFASMCAWQPLQEVFASNETKWYVTDENVEGHFLGFCMETNGADLQTYQTYVKNGTILGESVLIPSTYAVQKVCDMLGAQIVSKEITAYGEMIMAYSKRVPYAPVALQSNVQIMLTQEGIWVGVPVLYGSY